MRAGAGVGVCQIPIAARDASLVAVLPEWRIPFDLWVATHEDLRSEPRLRAVFDALAAGLSTYLASGAGAAEVAG